MRVIAFLVLMTLAGPVVLKAETTTTEVEMIGDPAVYGQFPKNYQEMITKWLETKLVDAPSANIQWLTTPRPADLPGPGGKRLYGYLVEFKLNSRNRFGAYTGWQKHGALIRDNLVLTGTGFGF